MNLNNMTHRLIGTQNNEHSRIYIVGNSNFASHLSLMKMYCETEIVHFNYECTKTDPEHTKNNKYSFIQAIIIK